MKKMMLVVLVLGMAALLASANGNTERISTIDGTLLLAPAGSMPVTIRTMAGHELGVEIPAAELVRLRLQDASRVKIRGVYVAGGAAARVRARIFARNVIADGYDMAVQEPVPLGDQDRLCIRLYDADRDQDQDQDQDQDRTMLRDQDPAGTAARTQGGASAGSGGTASGKR